MMWNSVSKIRFVCTLVVITICAGCGMADIVANKVFDPYKSHVDLSESSSDGVATIRGETLQALILARYCRVESPVKAKRVTINAGYVSIEVACGLTDSPTVFANVRFEALAGHEYLISHRKDCDYCIALLDATTNEVIVRAPYSCKNAWCTNLSTGDDWAVITRSKKRRCAIAIGQDLKPTRGVWIYVDAGQVSVHAVCPKSFRAPRKISSFDFVAEPGHTYRFAAKRKECMQLLDITSEETVIACEPYELVE